MNRFKYQVWNEKTSEFEDKQIPYKNVRMCIDKQDSEGELIYEGDILQTQEDEPYMIVKYCDKCSALTTFYPYSTEFIDTLSGEDEVPCDIEYCCQICENNCSMQDQFYDVKVVGNVHQTPELLEEQNK